MKRLFNVKKHFVISVIMATAMMFPCFAYAITTQKEFDKCVHPLIENDHCTGCNSYVIEYDYTANNNGAAKQGIKLNSTAGEFGDAVYLGTSQVGGKWYWFFDRVVTHIESGAFDKSKMEINLSEIELPEGVEKLDPNVFAGCVTLENITLPSTLTTIGSGAFSGCSNLQEITIPEGVTTIEPNAFSGCTSLESVTLPSTVTSIGEGAFNGCSDLDNITIPENVTSIGTGAFSGCTDLTSVTIPDNVTTIGDNAFSGCTGLTNVTIGESVESIGAGAFSDCTGITDVVVKSGDTNIDDTSFEGCTNVENVTGTLPQVEIIGGTSSNGGNTQNPETPQTPSIQSIKCDVLTDTEFAKIREEFPEAEVTFLAYERSNVGTWGTLCLPFDVKSDESVKYYQLSNVDLEKGVMEFSEMTDVPANTPCIFQNLSGGETLSFETPAPAVLPNDDVVKPLSIDGWSMIGTYRKKNVYVTEDSPNLYYIASNKFKYAVEYFVLKPFRAYFKYDGNVPANAASTRLSVEVVEENATSIKSAAMVQEDGILYDLLGNRVDQMVKGRIYILNGKKVMFK